MAKPPDKKAISAAVIALVESKDYRALKSQLIKMVDQHGTTPLQFAGELTVLNPLIDLGVKEPLKFEQVFNLIAQRRREKMMYYEEDRRKQRNEYMKEYMRLYRAKKKRPSPRGATGAAPKADADEDLDKILKS